MHSHLETQTITSEKNWYTSSQWEYFDLELSENPTTTESQTTEKLVAKSQINGKATAQELSIQF